MTHTKQPPAFPGRFMQPDQVTRYASALAADAGVRLHNVMRKIVSKAISVKSETL